MSRASPCRRPRSESLRSICVLPYYSANPYQDLLAGALERRGWLLRQFGRYHGLSQCRPGRDLIHLHWPPAVVSGKGRRRELLKFIVRLLRLRLKRSPIVWTVHNVIPHESEHPGLDLWLARLLGRVAHRVICHSREARDEIVHQYRLKSSRIAVIPHGHYIDSYPNTITAAEARRRLGLPPQGTVVLFLGLIRPYKGVDELLRAFIAANPADTTLVLAGQPMNGVDPGDLDEMAQHHPRVRVFSHFIPDDEIQVFMNAADIVAFPCRKALSSGTMILAMSFGKPCLAFDSPVARSVTDEESSILVSLKNPGALEEALRTLPAREVLRRKGERNLALIRPFDWDSIAGLTEQTYLQALS